MQEAVAIDAPHDSRNAFAHWVFESAVFLPIIKSEGKRVVLVERKMYKRLFCEYFGFTDADVDYGGNPCPTAPILMDRVIRPEYPLILSNFCAHFSTHVVPDVDFVLMPRQTAENYVSNDRKCKLTPFLDVFKTSGRSYRIVETDYIRSLQEQIDLVNSGRTLIVTDGSPALVNGVLCSGKTIYVVRDWAGGTVETQVGIYPMYRLIESEIKKKNTLRYINASDLHTLVA